MCPCAFHIPFMPERSMGIIMAGYDLICCIANLGDASKVLRIAKEYGVRGGTITIGTGTVHNRLLDFLGLYEVRREIVSMIVEEELAQDVLRGISEGMQFHKPHHGIAFSCSVSEFVGSKNIIIDKASSNEVKNSVYRIIHTIVEKGRGEDVVEVANKAGARGGTIMNARGSGVHEVQKLFNLEIEPEKEDVFIIAKTEEKDSIIDAIRTQMELDQPGKGILFVLDVKEVYGLHEG